MILPEFCAITLFRQPPYSWNQSGLSCFIHRSLGKTLCCFVEILALARLAPQHLDKRPRSWQSLEDNGQDMGSRPSLQTHSPEESLRFSGSLVNKKGLNSKKIKEMQQEKYGKFWISYAKQRESCVPRTSCRCESIHLRGPNGGNGAPPGCTEGRPKTQTTAGPLKTSHLGIQPLQ